MYSYVLNKPLAVSVSQIAHLSQLNHITLMVDVFFLKLENNLADKKDENMFNNENELIEYADKITINYDNLFCCDYLKSEVRKYIVEKANLFDSKFATDYDKIYIDNWFEFIMCEDLEQAEIKEDDKEDNISLFSQSESEDENAVYIETEEESEEESDSESEEDDNISWGSVCIDEKENEEESEEESDSESEEEEELKPGEELCIHCNEIQMECECIYCTNCDEKMAVCHCIADFHSTINELGAKNANHIREKEVLFERIKFLEAMNKQDTEIINQLTDSNRKKDNTYKLTEQTNHSLMTDILDARAYVNKMREEMKVLENKLEESEYNHSVDAKALFKEIRTSSEMLKQRDEFRIIIDNKDTEINELEEERDRLKGTIEYIKADKEENINNHKAVINRLREEAKEYKNEIDKKQELFNSAIKQRDEFQFVIVNKSKEINNLQTERDDLKASLNKMNKQIEEIKSSSWVEFCEISKLKEENKKLTKKVNEMKERIEELNNIIWDFKNKRDEQKDRLKKIEQSYIDRIKQLKSAREDYLELKEGIKKLIE
jgi:peptidoglycan hydrolase CwlO-like protein